MDLNELKELEEYFRKRLNDLVELEVFFRSKGLGTDGNEATRYFKLSSYMTNEILKSLVDLKKSYLKSYEYHRSIADKIWLKINDLDIQMQALADDIVMGSDFGGEDESGRWKN